jgi:asparagine synthase (glutamine-hydrolysing)
VCGIAGILAAHDGAPPTREELESMIFALRHRGPDGFGFHRDGPVGLAHARLSIIDLATGQQPMANEDQSIWTAFNGEIFNYVELRKELEQAGHRFSTHSDTETIVHAYEEFGDRFVERLNGQFAIALWDGRRRRLLLARDRLGIRPLFYVRDRGRLLFASEVKAIGAVVSAGLKLDVRGIAQIFTFWSTLGAQSVFAGVESLPPGHMLTIEGDSQRLTRYWDWDFSEVASVSALPRQEAAEGLRELLVDAVRLQLRSDVPVGAYLSGGLDSSAIVSLIRNYTSNTLRTFSVAFEDAEFDESAHQQEMVSYLGTEHTTIRCTRRDIGEQFPKLIWHTESPVVRTAPVPLMILSGLVRESGYKVVLTGEGSDEIFGGYDLFKEGKVRRFWARQPDSRWRPALFGRLYPYLRHSPVSNVAYAKQFFGQGLTDLANPGYAHLTRWATTGRLWNFFSPDVRQALEGSHFERELAGSLPASFSRWDGLARDQYVEAKTLLAGYLLSSQGDRVAMANSVEGRVPFLDHRVVEYANRLPARYKLSGLTEKAVLRDAMTGLLPNEIVKRVKQPYRAPDAPSFFEDGKPLPYVEALLAPGSIRDAGYFEPGAVTRLFEKCRAGKAIGFGDNMALVGVVSTMLVHEQLVKKKNTDMTHSRNTVE